MCIMYVLAYQSISIYTFEIQLKYYLELAKLASRLSRLQKRFCSFVFSGSAERNVRSGSIPALDTHRPNLLGDRLLRCGSSFVASPSDSESTTVARRGVLAQVAPLTPLTGLSLSVSESAFLGPVSPPLPSLLRHPSPDLSVPLHQMTLVSQSISLSRCARARDASEAGNCLRTCRATRAVRPLLLSRT